LQKLNCWEFKKCGRQRGGHNSETLGVCVATYDERLHGIHGGLNSGRACWMVAGTLCGGKVQGTFAQKMKNCLQCDFYLKVKGEEKGDFKMSAVLLKMVEAA